MQPARACECGEAAPCTGEFTERAKGLRVGTRFEHTCPGCQAVFSVHSTFGIGFSLFAALVLSGAGWLMVTHPPGAAVGAEESNRWFGWVVVAFAAGGWVAFAARLLARQRHPVRAP